MINDWNSFIPIALLIQIVYTYRLFSLHLRHNHNFITHRLSNLPTAPILKKNKKQEEKKNLASAVFPDAFSHCSTSFLLILGYELVLSPCHSTSCRPQTTASTFWLTYKP